MSVHEKIVFIGSKSPSCASYMHTNVVFSVRLVRINPHDLHLLNILVHMVNRFSGAARVPIRVGAIQMIVVLDPLTVLYFQQIFPRTRW